MSKRGKVFVSDIFAGIIKEDESGFTFTYDQEYLRSDGATPVSLALPLQEKPYASNVMFSFFDGLIPEGWLLEIGERNWKIDRRDRMQLLLLFCRDCIGAVSVIQENEK